MEQKRPRGRTRPGQTLEERREEWLRSVPHWDEIELRLRHRWSPERTMRWFEREYPDVRGPGVKTLYRYLKDKADTWFVSPELLTKYGSREVSKLLILEEHRELVVAAKLRLINFLKNEQDLPIPIPELTRQFELVARLEREHLTMQQELGLEPKKVEALPLTAPADGSTRRFARLIERVIELDYPQLEALERQVVEVVRQARPALSLAAEGSDEPRQ